MITEGLVIIGFGLACYTLGRIHGFDSGFVKVTGHWLQSLSENNLAVLEIDHEADRIVIGPIEGDRS